MFVNGPNGRIASYYQNNSSYLYYFISDQLGSTRVVMKGTPPATLSNPYIVAEYYNYYPFGQVAEASGNYATAFQWTSKEHDQHGGFDYVYFGSRYYDPRVGAFGTVDKAGQFASGYVYGANNPIIGVDRDGNFFWLAFALGAFAGGCSGAQIAMQNGAGPLEGLFDMSIGAAIGGFSGVAGADVAHGVSAVAGLATGSFANSMGMRMLSGGQLPIQVSLGLGNLDLQTGKFKWNDFSGDWLEDIGTAMGGFAVLEDANRAYANLFGKVPKEVAATVGESKALAGGQASDRDFYEEYSKVDLETGKETLDVPPDHADNNPRPPGHYHYDLFRSDEDPSGGGRVVVHTDAFGSGIRNPGTAIQHMVFEAGPFDMLKKIGINIRPGSLAAQPFYLPGAFYRTFPSVNYNRNVRIF